MKEELKKYLISIEKDYWYGCDSYVMGHIVDEFFEKYEKCELGHDFFTIPLSDQRDCSRCGEMYDPKIHGE